MSVKTHHLRAALAVWQYCEDSARYISGNSLGDPIADKLLQNLHKSSKGLSQTQIRRQGEAVNYGADPTWNLQENGATTKEIAFLCKSRGWRSYRGNRVELNAFTSDQFVEWLDFKLTKHGVKKVIPDEETLKQAYRRVAAVRRYQKIVDRAGKEIETYAKGLKLPGNLCKRLAKMLSEDPALPWDEALARLVEIEGKAHER